MANIYIFKNGAWYNACDCSMSKNGVWYGLNNASIMKNGTWYTNECNIIPMFGDFNGDVYDIQVQSDNKMIIGGGFTSYSGQTYNRIIRLNSNGSIDGTFQIGTGFNAGIIVTLGLQSDNKIITGGGAGTTTYSGITFNNIVRINSGGTIDNTFNYSNAFNSQIQVVKVVNNKIFVGGFFTTYSGITANRFIKLNSDCTIDNTFSGATTGFDGAVYDFIIEDDGKISLVGGFIGYNSVTSNGFVRLLPDGTRDTTLSVGAGFNSGGRILNSIVKYSNDYIIGGALMTNYKGTRISNFARIDSGGTIVSNFATSGFSSTGGASITKITVTQNNKLLISGDFTHYSGISVNNLIKLNSDSTIDTTFRTYVFNSIVRVAYERPDTNIVAGGDFTTYSGLSKSRVIVINSGGTALY